MQRLVIYLPSGGCDQATEQKLRDRYPTAEFVTRWQDGAVMWQDALARVLA